jgi:pimeloyl-ACP methyl ester carboxylesterase
MARPGRRAAVTAVQLDQGFTPSGVQYLQSGEGGNGLLVFTHGWRDSALGWQWVIGELERTGASAGWRVASVQRGEVARRDEDTGGLLEDFSDQVVDVILHLARPGERVVIVGQSMGGPVAELAATKLPGLVVGLVLVTPAPLAGWPLPDEVLETFKAGGRELDRVNAALARTGLVLSTGDATTLRVILSTPAETERASLQSLASWVGGHPAGSEKSKVTAPTMVVVTDDDFFPEQALRSDVAARFADARVGEVRGAGHFPHLERPEQLARLIAGYLTELG